MGTVYVVIKGGIVEEAYADHETDLVVLDKDTQDPEMLEEIEATIERLSKHAEEIEIL